MTLEHTPAANFVLRYSTKLNLPAMVQSAAALLSNAAEKMDIFQPRSPISIASAAIYMASQVRYLEFWVNIGHVNKIVFYKIRCPS